ncbi:MAG: ABC transporter substrate-binding protein [Mycobacterium sp.]|nr:ABC transporter substrate-binding protein [Mycobacterium sp.]
MRKWRALGSAALAVSLALVAGCSANTTNNNNNGNGTGALEKITFLAGIAILGREGYVYDAIEKGYFRQAGFDVTVQTGQASNNLRLLQSGQAQVATIDVSAAIIAYASGEKDFTLVGAAQQSNLSTTLVLSNSGIKTPQDLKGKRIGYITSGTNKPLFSAYAQQAKIDVAHITWVPFSPAAIQSMPAALASHRVDALSAFAWDAPGFGNTIKPGDPTVLTSFPFNNYITDLYGSGWAVTKKYAADHPDRVQKLVDALKKGLTDTVQDPQSVAKIYAKYVHLQPEPAAAAELSIAKLYIQPGGVAIGSINQQKVAKSIALLESLGLISSAPSPADVCTCPTT